MNGQELLNFLRSRRSVRAFTPEQVTRDVLERVLEAATSAPSATNRQPWKFTVVTDPELKGRVADAIAAKTAQIDAIAQRGHHSEEMTAYWRYFHEPIRAAAALVVPQYRQHTDLLAGLIESGGGDPKAFVTGDAMQAELAAVSAATMALLLQAHAEGLGACWMTGPLVALEELCRLLEIRDPWRPISVVALGRPAEEPTPKPRKPLAQVTQWFEAASKTEDSGRKP